MDPYEQPTWSQHCTKSGEYVPVSGAQESPVYILINAYVELVMYILVWYHLQRQVFYFSFIFNYGFLFSVFFVSEITFVV